ncbi:MAG TPA: 3-hydroxyacyl-CoA dehydrogenase NAD-binding domain-containing protein, partial [Nitrolancea sp.]|nr:3-hydroxyacyl-CoA dehydrogenase NAD-binding domain-containing protein [Nitrolancea sp.]
MDITRIAVVGAGTMGAGIVQVMAQAGIVVTMIDRDETILNRSLGTIQRDLSRAVERGRLSPDDADIALSVIQVDTDIRAVDDADLVIEAVPEVLDLKLNVFRSMDEFAPAGAILASNTSSISITRLGAETKRPAQVVGMHFFNPVP